MTSKCGKKSVTLACSSRAQPRSQGLLGFQIYNSDGSLIIVYSKSANQIQFFMDYIYLFKALLIALLLRGGEVSLEALGKNN